MGKDTHSDTPPNPPNDARRGPNGPYPHAPGGPRPYSVRKPMGGASKRRVVLIDPASGTPPPPLPPPPAAGAPQRRETRPAPLSPAQRPAGPNATAPARPKPSDASPRGGRVVELNPKVSGFGAKHGSPKKITDFGPLRRDGGPNGGKPFPPKGNFGKGGFRGAATPKPSPRKSPAEFRFTKYPPTLAGQSRLFLAIPLPDHVIAEIAKLREHSPLMAKKLREFKLHVTLKYLGYVPSETLPLIVKKLSEVKFAPFEIALPGMHVYKFNRKKKELILKVEDTDPLRLLKRSVSLALKPLRLPPIRVIHQVPVIPHVSLIYPPRVPSPDLDNLLARHNRHFGSFKAEKFVLYLTTTTEANLEHTALHSFSAS